MYIDWVCVGVNYLNKDEVWEESVKDEKKPFWLVSEVLVSQRGLDLRDNDTTRKSPIYVPWLMALYFSKRLPSCFTSRMTRSGSSILLQAIILFIKLSRELSSISLWGFSSPSLNWRVSEHQMRRRTKQGFLREFCGLEELCSISNQLYPLSCWVWKNDVLSCRRVKSKLSKVYFGGVKNIGVALQIESQTSVGHCFCFQCLQWLCEVDFERLSFSFLVSLSLKRGVNRESINVEEEEVRTFFTQSNRSLKRNIRRSFCPFPIATSPSNTYLRWGRASCVSPVIAFWISSTLSMFFRCFDLWLAWSCVSRSAL